MIEQGTREKEGQRERERERARQTERERHVTPKPGHVGPEIIINYFKGDALFFLPSSNLILS